MHFTNFLAKVFSRLRLLPKFNSTVTIIVEQRKFVIPLLGDQGYGNLNLSEPWMTEILISLRPLFNGQFVDVGVNTGQTLLKAEAVFKDVNYIGFEPNPSCVNYVQEMIRMNGFKNALLLPIGVGAKTEILKLNFFATDKNDSSATIVENFKKDTKPDHSIFVPVFDFHQLTHFLSNQPGSILKIDVEGAEMEVLLGLNEWIEAYHPLILLEILPIYTSDNESRLSKQQKIEELLLKLNYKKARIKKKNRATIEQIETFGIHSNIEDCDYLLYHSTVSEKISTCFKKLTDE
jgi:FkbM family methyltransferase